jgi:hypothetical protein
VFSSVLDRRCTRQLRVDSGSESEPKVYIYLSIITCEEYTICVLVRFVFAIQRGLRYLMQGLVSFEHQSRASPLCSSGSDYSKVFFVRDASNNPLETDNMYRKYFAFS